MVKRTAEEDVEVGGSSAETNSSEPAKKRVATEKTTETPVEEKVAVAEERDAPPEDVKGDGPEVIDNASSVPKQDDPSAFSAQQVQFLLDELNRSKARLAATSMLLARQTGMKANPTLMQGAAGSAGAAFPSTLTAARPLGFPPTLSHMGSPYLPPFGGAMLAPPNAAYGLRVPLPSAGLLPHQPPAMERISVAAGDDPQGAMMMSTPYRTTGDTKHLNFLKMKKNKKAAPNRNPTRKGSAEGTANGPEEDGLCIPLALPFDKHRLSSFQYLLRQQIDLFEATRGDVYGNAQGRNTPIVRGQVGIRCHHCHSHLNYNPERPIRKKPRGSVYFPTKLNGLYQAAQNMAINHFFTKSCQFISPQILDDLVKAKKNKTYHLGGGKSYWATSAEVQNICEYDNRLWFCKKGSSVPRKSFTIDPLLSATTSTSRKPAVQQEDVPGRDCNAPQSDSAGVLDVDAKDARDESRQEEVAADQSEPKQTKTPPSFEHDGPTSAAAQEGSELKV